MLFVGDFAVGHGPSVVSSVAKHREVAMGLLEKTPVLEKLHSGVSDNAAGCEFNITELTTH